MDHQEIMAAILGPLGALAMAVVAYWMERSAHAATRRECATERQEQTGAIVSMTSTLAGLSELVRTMASRRGGDR